MKGPGKQTEKPSGRSREEHRDLRSFLFGTNKKDFSCCISVQKEGRLVSQPL